MFDIATPPEPNWLVKAFGWVAGPAHLVAGYGGSGKTFALQSAALSIAAGRAVWGYYPSRRGAVLHLDYEQGPRVTIERYHRLLSGMGLTRSDVGRLEYQYCSNTGGPHQLTIGAADADRLERLMMGRDLLIIDSLRAAVGSLDENDSRIREPLDLLGHLSAVTGFAVICVHHARKMNVRDDAQQARFAVRGSSAIFDACASVLVLTGRKNELKTMCHEKSRESQPLDDFNLVIQDIDDDAKSIVISALHEQESDQSDEAQANRADLLEKKALLLLESASHDLTMSALRKGMQVRGEDASQVANHLVSSGKIERVTGSRGAHLYRLSSSKKTTPDDADMDARVLSCVATYPYCSMNQLHKLLGGRKGSLMETVSKLIQKGKLTKSLGSRGAHLLRITHLTPH